MNAVKLVYLAPLWLVGIALLVWSCGLFGEPVYDDTITLTRNPALRDFDVAHLLSEPFFREHLHYWRPLTNVVLASATQLGFYAVHLVALLLHWLTALVVLHLLRGRFGGASWVAPWGAALFLVHPMNAESVCWASALSGVLSGFLSVVAVRYAVAATTRGYWLAAVSMFGALLAKESALALAPVIAVAPLWTDPTAARRILVRHALRVGATVVVWFSVRHAVLGSTAMAVPNGSLLQLLCGSAEVFVRQLTLLVWPSPLTPFRSGPDAITDNVLGGLAIGYALTALVVLAAVALAVLRVPRLRVPLLLVVCPALVPAVSWFGLGEFPIQERYLYVSTVGFVLLLAELAGRFPSSAILLAIGAAILAHLQSRIWQDQDSLIRHGLASAPQLATVHVMAGDLDLIAANLGDSPSRIRARDHYGMALRSRLPRDMSLAKERLAAAHIGLGWCDFLAPETEFPRDASRVAANFRSALREDDRAAAAWVGLGSTYALAKDQGDAEQAFGRALEIDPTLPEAWYNLGCLQMEHGAVVQAQQSFAQALRYSPGMETAKRMLARLRR